MGYILHPMSLISQSYLCSPLLLPSLRATRVLGWSVGAMPFVGYLEGAEATAAFA